ncbi:MAG: two-component system, NtrC family, response regulator HydG [Acidobacteriota bacterium]|jgi:DNA-binding NtrC family response regulator|nr:two-component system, NtrC family, response regulator HydG [Acidobacteriota bacterium]
MSRKIRVMVVDDDAVLRKLVSDQVARMGFDSTPAASGEEALETLAKSDFDVVLLDIRMPGLSGLDTLREVRKLEDSPEVIMLTADTSLGTGIEAMRLGAYDYLTKPAMLDEIEAVIRKADEKRRLVRQNASLKDAVRPASDEAQSALVFKSKAMEGLVALAETAARADSTVVITGESGTGKDVLARFIHARSQRADSPMIAVNCAALPETLFESEFFGHERGAFTGATSTKRGLIEAADSSTLFLDEVGEMPAQTQVKLLRFLEEGCFRRVGSTRDREADVRVVAATNRNLADDVTAGRFRADLFYRLNVISLHVTPLRQRREDIPALVEHFLALFRERFNRPALDLSPEARARLTSHDWPGNVRELRNTLERAAALASTDADRLEADDVLPLAAPRSGEGKTAADSTPMTLEQLERQHILRVLEDSGGNRERAAALLGISARTLYRKLREYETGTAVTTES